MNISRALSLGLLALTGMCQAQYASNKVSLYSHISLTEFQSINGNSCWGYVSPSGREYAIMGLDNKVAFVDITNPRTPVVVDTIAHTSNLWGDVKVYGTACYAVTEDFTGIQVMDLSNIDNGDVTLVRTIGSPARNHTIAVDPISGFLYTCGSRNGTGTTTCFSLANPLNPVQVGSNSLTPVYIHEALVVTYTSGTYAGRQIFFGNSEGRGLDIYDVTNKSGVFLIKRIPYANVSYGHQCWISADMRYIYLDDELDEYNYGIPSRTRVFDVSNLSTAFLASTFDSGASSIDHNQYWRDGFLFQANYRSGLRVVDTNDNPLAPRQAGFFDTYIGSDAAEFNGAWSNYPFFPSNTVIVSDIEGGLFVLNVQEATTRTFPAKTFTLLAGSQLGGNLTSLGVSDNNYLQVINDPTTLDAGVEFSGISAIKRLSELKVMFEGAAGRPSLSQILEVRKFSSNSWQSVDSRVAPTDDTPIEVRLTTNASSYVGSDGTVRFRVRWATINDDDPAQDGWPLRTDRAAWTAIPYAAP